MMDIGVYVVVALLLPLVHSDVYLHTPAGSNNRNIEQYRECRNQQRLFDSQNNIRGGYNKGGGNVDDYPMRFVAGSILPIEWTSQHECGQENTRCDIILQYMCDPNLRDGTIQMTHREDIYDNDVEFGRHESPEYYRNCKVRKRNEGLFTADQRLKGPTARFTRQNPEGNRYGLECPEERDYYPYWGPTPWKDIAVLTDDTSRCGKIKRESQNVKSKWHCAFLSEKVLMSPPYLAPITKEECEKLPSNQYAWVEVPAHNIAAPECLQAPKSRDNHLGNGINANVEAGRDGTSETIPQTLSYKWKVPNIASPACALRIRYNISVLDYNPETTTSNDNKNIDIKGLYGITGNDRGYRFEKNPTIRPLSVNGNIESKFQLELAINTARTGRTFQDRSHKFLIVQRDTSKIPLNATIHNLMTRGRRGNIVQVYPAVEYDFVPNVLKVKLGDYIHPQWTGALNLPPLDEGVGRRGADKHNMILLKPKPFVGSEDTKRFGYPTTNYPQPIDKNRIMGLDIRTARKLAFPAGRDRPYHYFQDPCPRAKKDEVSDELESEFGTLSSFSDETLTKLNDVEKHDGMRRSTTTIDVELAEEEIDDEGEVVDDDVEDSNDPQRRSIRRRRRTRRRRRRRRQQQSTSSGTRRSTAGTNPLSGSGAPLVALKQNYACKKKDEFFGISYPFQSNLNDNAAYVDIGPQKTQITGEWIYMCTRNNNFSNRSQKGKIIVE